MKKVALDQFKKLSSKELSKVQGGAKYYLLVNGTLIEVEI
ncbi:ComC/BlpC family leader-containing pheromone/bacteriocin [Dysgonomonas macrotermitis]|uniref:Bacteriocin-type signal sequence-containing protein n=1 Tax=Dysgonomonas macrotermitis TaxID=1346286 RepID=A0A1M5CXI2_9BACT|nr:ComC/BlpC family leader-containing pheromone/bacteriocin [Dysgonomonas macrotermitis]SHF59463.1 bacteriocin-type signal sequence-containing protein [Dysgonomonas macrotermitis]